MHHSFDVNIATKYGVNCAIILNNLQFWIAKNKANGKNFHDGRYWTFNSAEAFAELFPYMTARQISYALQKLRDEGILETGNYNANAYDRTLWYALTDFGECILQNCQMDSTALSNGFDSNVEPIPDINPDAKTSDSKTDILPTADAKGKPVRHQYGQYKNVLLSDVDVDKLKSEFPNDWEQRIEELSEGIATHGYKYKNHLAAIRTWARREAKKNGKGGRPSKETAEQIKQGCWGVFV